MPALRRAPTEQPPTEFEAARAAYNDIVAEERRLSVRLEGLRAIEALAFSTSQQNSTIKDWPKDVFERRVADAFPDGRVPRPKKVPEEIDAAEEALFAIKPKISDARIAYQIAEQVETDRIAQELQPRHRQAVVAIADALEGLSAALAGEEAVRSELQRRAPSPESAYLPNCSDGLLIGRLDQPNSPAARWAAAIRRLGIA